MNNTVRYATALFALSTAGCSLTPKEIVGSKEVTVSSALDDVGEGIARLQKKFPAKIGIFPCRLSVVLNVKASAVEEGKLVVDTSIKPGPGLTSADTVADAKATGTLGALASAERGNIVSIDLLNPGCLPKDTLGYDKPEKVGAAAEGMGRSLQFAPVSGDISGGTQDSDIDDLLNNRLQN